MGYQGNPSLSCVLLPDYIPYDMCFGSNILNHYHFFAGNAFILDKPTDRLLQRCIWKEIIFNDNGNVYLPTNTNDASKRMVSNNISHALDNEPVYINVPPIDTN